MMKSVPKKNISLKQTAISFACIGLIFFSLPLFAARPLPVSKKEMHYSILVNKTQNNKKYKVRLYVKDENNAVLFTVNGIDGKTYQLFIYDLDSNLVQETRIQNHQVSTLENILKGNYLFDILVNDEKIESGQLTVK